MKGGDALMELVHSGNSPEAEGFRTVLELFLREIMVRMGLYGRDSPRSKIV